MYGTIISYNGYSVWVQCTPTTSEKDKIKKAKAKVEKYLNGEIDSLM
jgi:hypothetical protein